MTDEIQVVDRLWFSGTMGTVGIVVVEDHLTGERKAYIGAGRGEDEGEDTDCIIAWGSTLHLETLKGIERQLSKESNGS